MDYTMIVTVVAAVLAGVVVALKVIAPRTKNTVDDKALAYAEKAEELVEPLVKK